MVLQHEKAIALNGRVEQAGAGLDRALGELPDRQRLSGAESDLGFAEPAPRDWVTRSRKQTWLVLNPGVFRFARLLPTTSMAVDVAFSADSAVENDVNMRAPL